MLTAKIRTQKKHLRQRFLCQTCVLARKRKDTKKRLEISKRFLRLGWKMGFEPTTFETL